MHSWKQNWGNSCELLKTFWKLIFLLPKRAVAEDAGPVLCDLLVRRRPRDEPHECTAGAARFSALDLSTKNLRIHRSALRSLFICVALLSHWTSSVRFFFFNSTHCAEQVSNRRVRFITFSWSGVSSAFFKNPHRKSLWQLSRNPKRGRRFTNGETFHCGCLSLLMSWLLRTKI